MFIIDSDGNFVKDEQLLRDILSLTGHLERFVLKTDGVSRIRKLDDSSWDEGIDSMKAIGEKLLVAKDVKNISTDL